MSLTRRTGTAYMYMCSVYVLTKVPVSTTCSLESHTFKGTNYPGNTYTFQEVNPNKIAKSADQHRERFHDFD